MTVGESIKSVRLEKGFTQKQVADACGMADSAIRKYESGKIVPKLETLRRIAGALGVEWTELVDGDTAAKMTIDHVVGKLNALSTPIERVTRDMSQMTQEGQEKVAGYAADILPRYRAETTPKSTLDSTEGTAAPPTEGPQEPSEGE